MSITDFYAGQPVRFTYAHGETEDGFVSSVGTANVFVRFGVNPQAQACDPEMLTPLGIQMEAPTP